jgi:hypothetical protein
MEVNKLMGFYELKRVGLNAPKFKLYKLGDPILLEDDILYTVRTAVYIGKDMSLPREVGVNKVEAKAFAENTLKRLGDNAQIIIYPFFHAYSSGTLISSGPRILIEACKNDLWNLVDHNIIDYRYIGVVSLENGAVKYDTTITGDLLSSEQILELVSASDIVNRKFSDEVLIEGKSLYLEWSYAVPVNEVTKEPLDQEPELVFYELRIID